jgi:DNA-binding TFAR19-related protein (PDSD5 family)
MQADDPELEAIRQRRMAQLMAQQGGGSKGPATPEEAQAQEEQRQAAEEQRRAMLMNIMQPSARDRCEYCMRHAYGLAWLDVLCAVVQPS